MATIRELHTREGYGPLALEEAAEIYGDLDQPAVCEICKQSPATRIEEDLMVCDGCYVGGEE